MVQSVDAGLWWGVSRGVSPVAVVGSRPEAYAALETVRRLGLESSLYEDVGALSVGGVDPALVVIVGGKLARAARDLRTLGEIGDRPLAIAVCDAVRPGEVRLALSAGMAGVVLAASLTVTLGPAIAAAMAGQVCVPMAQARQVDAASLSLREKQILGLVVMGCMNSEIADRLVVAESTVKSHLSSVFAKLGVRSRHEAVDLILDSERGLGMGILGLGGEPIEPIGSASG